MEAVYFGFEIKVTFLLIGDGSSGEALATGRFFSADAWEVTSASWPEPSQMAF